MIGFLVGGAAGFAVGFVIGVDYGRRHSEPWKDLKETAEDAVTWTKRTMAGGPKAPVPPPAPPKPADPGEPAVSTSV